MVWDGINGMGLMGWDRIGREGWDGMGWDGMGWDGTGREGTGCVGRLWDGRGEREGVFCDGEYGQHKHKRIHTVDKIPFEMRLAWNPGCPKLERGTKILKKLKQKQLAAAEVTRQVTPTILARPNEF